MDASRAKSFADLFTSALAVYGMIVGTPIGGITARLWHWTTGQRSEHRPLLDYFETASEPDRRGPGDRSHPLTGGPGLSFEAAALTNPLPPAVVAPSGIPPNLARAVALILSNGKIVEGGNFDVRLSRAARRALSREGVRAPADESSAADRERALFTGLVRLSDRLKSEEAAVAALAVDLEDLQFALAMARAADPDNAGRYEVFRGFLPSGHRDEVDDLVDGTFALATAFSIRWPLDRPGPITSRFGLREDPLLHEERSHWGIDVSVPLGTPILAAADGRVLFAATDGSNGRYVKLDHGHGLTTVYCHASKLEVRHDARVKRGGLVALAGATGRATGPHLHFQIEINQTPIDPEVLLPRSMPARP